MLDELEATRKSVRACVRTSVSVYVHACRCEFVINPIDRPVTDRPILKSQRCDLHVPINQQVEALGQSLGSVCDELRDSSASSSRGKKRASVPPVPLSPQERASRLSR